MMKPHDILRVKVDADLETIKRAYRKLARTVHPDAGGSKEDFVRLHAAYETMVEQWKAREASPGPTASGGNHERRADVRSFEDIMQEVAARLDRELAQRLSEGPQRAANSAAGFWIAVVLTPLCAGIVATCLCYDGTFPERPIWFFSFTVALVGLVYVAFLSAAVGSSLGTSCLTLYLRILILVSLAIVLIALPRSQRGHGYGGSKAIISRELVPSWWPMR